MRLYGGEYGRAWRRYARRLQWCESEYEVRDAEDDYHAQLEAEREYSEWVADMYEEEELPAKYRRV